MATTPATTPRVSLREALEDRRLLGAGFRPHPRQLELLEAIAGTRLVVAAAGRRFGKTKAAAAAALHNLLLIPELDELVALGERRYALSVANSREQAKIFVAHALALVTASPTLRRELISQTATELTFTRNRILSAFPCTAKSTRGYAASFVCLDEFAHHYDDEEGGPAVAPRIWSAMTPSVAQFGDLGRIVVISTPLGSDGTFAELYAKAQNGEIVSAVAFHAPTSANPRVGKTFLEEQEAVLGHDDFRREYGAEFIAGGASFIENSAIRACVQDWREALPADGRDWVVGFDAAFSSDPSAIAVVGRRPDDRTRLICGHTERWLPSKTSRRVRRTREEETARIEEVIANVATVAATFQARVVVDQHLPGTVVHELAKHGVHAAVRPWTPESRTQAAQAVRARILTERIELPNAPQLVAELSRLRTRYRGGSAMVELPRAGDSHCDQAVALMAAVAELDRYGVGANPEAAGLYWDPITPMSPRVRDGVGDVFGYGDFG